MRDEAVMVSWLSWVDGPCATVVGTAESLVWLPRRGASQESRGDIRQCCLGQAEMGMRVPSGEGTAVAKAWKVFAFPESGDLLFSDEQLRT